MKTTIFDMAKQIKKEIISLYAHDKFSTYEDIINSIESKIKNSGFEPAFPTVISPDYRVSNWTPINEERNQKLSFEICTVDFGIVDNKGRIIDTAITLTKDPLWEINLIKYRKIIETIEHKINEDYVKNKFIKGSTITKIVECCFENSPFYIISECAAHKISPYVLHAETILMKGKGVPEVILKEGDCFTIEPHVTLEKTHIVQEKGTIFLDCATNKYNTIDHRLGPKTNTKSTVLYSAIKANKKSFYEEDTYILEKRLINTTKV